MISVELKGRLGNQLFQYSMCRIMADKLNVDYSIPNNWLGYNFFNLPKNYNGKGNLVFNEGVNEYNKNVFSIKDNTHLNGYWQSDKYLIGYENDIRKWFHVEDLNIEQDLCVIHYRAQDGYLWDNYLLPINYFNLAKDYILKINSNIKFIVVTDNKQLATKNFDIDDIILTNAKESFQLIKSAKYKIISNSTFSWWASWLNLPKTEIVIAPNRWMNYNFNKYKEDKFYPHDVKTKGFIYI
jgi:hypothetical protein